VLVRKVENMKCQLNEDTTTVITLVQNDDLAVGLIVEDYN
jgi:hypothetical protein